MIQIRELVEFTNAKGNAVKKDQPLDPDIQATSVKDLFDNLEVYLKDIPEDKRINYYYTAGNGDHGKKRAWSSQQIISFDIDHIEIKEDNTIDFKYVEAITTALMLDYKKTAFICTGNGLQVIVFLPKPIEQKNYFTRNKKFYQLVLSKIQQEFNARGLTKYVLDPTSFGINRILRLPNTWNIKPSGRKKAYFIQRNLEPQAFDIKIASGTPDIAIKDSLNIKELKSFAIDSDEVEKGCNFLGWAKRNQRFLSEPQWYAMLSVVGRLDNGEEKAQEYSNEHSDYTPEHTARKLQQALEASGPRTCENIDTLWEGCKACPHYGRITSPVQIHSDSFIATEDHGFQKVTEKGVYIPQYDDLLKYFTREKPYFTSLGSSMVYVYDNKEYCYKPMLREEIEAFAMAKFKPLVSSKVAKEFAELVRLHNLRDFNENKEKSHGKINFANGVLDTATGEMLPHSKEYGFLYCLPFAYDPDATSPIFDGFMKDITGHDPDLESLLLEFVGYGLCDNDYWLEKFMILIGDGANGKSTFLNIVKKLGGASNMAHLSLNELHSETHRFQLEGKLLNISDELPQNFIKSTDLLKKLTGGMMSARRLFQNTASIVNTAKLIFAGNSIPSTIDTSHGLFRRAIIVPFNQTFNVGDNADPYLLRKIEVELPGVFNRVYACYQSLVERGDITVSEKSQKELESYREEVDNVGLWIKDNLTFTIHDDYSTAPFLAIDELYYRYVSDCKRYEERPVRRFNFLKRLKKTLNGTWELRRMQKRTTDGRHRGVGGVKWADMEDNIDIF